MSLRDVAKLAEVSVATVSMVLNDNPRISRATQLRVRQVMDQTGYRPNRLAQSLSGRYTQVLAVVLPALRHGFGDAYFGELISGICDRAGKLGYKVMLEQAKPEFVKEREHIALFERRFVDGALCLGCNDRHPFLKDFVESNYPIVVVDNYFDQWRLDHVVCDYRGGAEQVMNYLLQLGHREIGLIFAAPEAHTARDVASVYRERARRRRRRVRRDAHRRRQVHRGGRGRRRRADPRAAPRRRPRSSPATTRWRSARCTTWRAGACACRRTCRSSGSTTCSTPRSSTRA